MILSRNRRGFTMVELIIVIVVLGLLAAIAILKYQDLRNTARAAEVAGAIRVVTVGAYNHYGDFQNWPPDGAAGAVPPALAPYLPPGFLFDNPNYTLDYDNLGVGGGAYMIGVTIMAKTPDLMAKLVKTLGTKTPFFSAGGTLTYVIVGPDGKI
jgi:prepilin-type N-terminal cleavage/methylation domain-containing protein